MKIAILGMGKIGSGVYEYAAANENLEVVKTLDLKAWMDNMTTDIDDIVNDPEIEAVVETMGGLEPAKTYALKCLNAGKHYVTANKHLVSEAMEELKAAAENSGAAFLFSAACGGGIPVLKCLYDQALSDEIVEFGGILNGTTNYMLDRIETDNLTYDAALKEAQALGYAEADPTSDVDGLDAQRKLILGLAVGFGIYANANQIPVSGIRNIAPVDIAYFKGKGVSPRLIASCKKTDSGVSADVCVHLFNYGAPETAIKKNVNYAYYTGKQSGNFAFSGQGAGKYPTAANVIGDLTRIISGAKHMLPGKLSKAAQIGSGEYAYYVRVPEDKAEAFKDIACSVSLKDGYALIETNKVNHVSLLNTINATGESFFARMHE
ncbi:MAG: homoserine dehydrogenase [Clostridia bacterium]|nr:homoserine dehydrogenase [Clostridia bacterium]